MRIGVTVGSRGIDNISLITKTVIKEVKNMVVLLQLLLQWVHMVVQKLKVNYRY
jgi:hypothetical protein